MSLDLWLSECETFHLCLASSLILLPLFNSQTSLMRMRNTQSRHILLRSNEALLDLILELSGCLDFLVSAFTFAITSLDNFSFAHQKIWWLMIALSLLPSSATVSSNAAPFCTSSRHCLQWQVLKSTNATCCSHLKLIMGVNQAVTASCHQADFLYLLDFYLLLFPIASLRCAGHSLGGGFSKSQWEYLSTFLEFSGSKFHVMTLISYLIKGSNDEDDNKAVSLLYSKLH